MNTPPMTPTSSHTVTAPIVSRRDLPYRRQIRIINSNGWTGYERVPLDRQLRSWSTLVFRTLATAKDPRATSSTSTDAFARRGPHVRRAGRFLGTAIFTGCGAYGPDARSPPPPRPLL